MKKISTVVMVISLLVTIISSPTYATTDNEPSDENYLSQLSAMIQKYDSSAEYFSSMSVTIGESNLIIDGAEKPIDESGSIA